MQIRALGSYVGPSTLALSENAARCLGRRFFAFHAEAVSQPLADFQGQLDPDPDHHFPAVDLQIFSGTGAGRTATMQGFVKSYFNQRQDLVHSQKIMYYFKQSDLPVLGTLTQFELNNYLEIFLILKRENKKLDICGHPQQRHFKSLRQLRPVCPNLSRSAR